MHSLYFRQKVIVCGVYGLFTASLAFGADPAAYNKLKESYDQARVARLSIQYTNTFPSISTIPFWGALNKSIAAIGTHRPVDETLLINTINAHASALEKLPIIGHDGSDLSWPLLMRLYYLGNNTNGIYRGAISPSVENRLLEHYYYILSRNAVVVPYDVNAADVASEPVGTWNWSNDSENHIYSKQSSYLLMLQALHNNSNYRNRVLPNGYSVEASYQRWLAHWNMFLEERIKHGPVIEVGAITYSKYTLAAIMNLIDFPEDRNLREKARNLADIIFATTATETLPNGTRGGSKSRKYTLTSVGNEPFGSFFVKLYLNPADKEPGGNQLSPIFLTSSYFPASVVTSLWKNAVNDKAFELHARVPGVLRSGTRNVDPSQAVYHYTYMTPSYSMGSSNLDPSHETYAAASSESRVASVIMNDASGGKTPYISFSPGEGQCFDRAVTAQNKNVMIVQNNIPFWKEGHERCFGKPTSIIDNLRTTRNGALITYPVADRWISSDGYDTTENHVDVLLSPNMQTSEDNGALIAVSPDNKVFTWIKPVIGSFHVLDGYNPDNGLRSATYAKNAYLDTDKFSPYVVISAPAANYDGSLYKFQTEMNFMSRITYTNGVVAVQPSLRTQLEPNDIFIDSVNAKTTGNWSVITGRGEHEKSSLRADSVEKTELSLTFTVPKSGIYYIRARVGASPGHRFLVSLDGRPSVSWQFANTVRSWEAVSAFRSDNKVYLVAGTHTMKLAAGEAGSLFDALALFYARDVGPTTLQYVENIDRTQPEATLNGMPLHSHPAFNTYTFKSPHVSSIKDSGSWLIQFGDEVLSLGTTRRSDPIVKEAEDAIGLPSNAIKVDVDGKRFVELSGTVKTLPFELNIPTAGRYMLYGRTRGFDGKSNSFTVLVNGATYTWSIPKDGTWSSNSLRHGGANAVLSLPAGKVPLSINLREGGSQIDSITLIQVQ